MNHFIKNRFENAYKSYILQWFLIIKSALNPDHSLLFKKLKVKWHKWHISASHTRARLLQHLLSAMPAWRKSIHCFPNESHLFSMLEFYQCLPILFTDFKLFIRSVHIKTYMYIMQVFKHCAIRVPCTHGINSRSSSLTLQSK